MSLSTNISIIFFSLKNDILRFGGGNRMSSIWRFLSWLSLCPYDLSACSCLYLLACFCFTVSDWLLVYLRDYLIFADWYFAHFHLPFDPKNSLLLSFLQGNETTGTTRGTNGHPSQRWKDSGYDLKARDYLPGDMALNIWTSRQGNIFLNTGIKKRRSMALNPRIGKQEGMTLTPG